MGAGEQEVTDIVDQLEFVFKNTVDFLKFAEAKNGVLIGFCGAAIFGLIKVVLDDHIKIGIAGTVYFYQLFVALTCALSLALMSFVPQTKIGWMFGRLSSANRNNVIFFGEIRNLSPDKYIDELAESIGLENYHPSKYESDMANQIVVNSAITYKKFNFFRFGVWALIGGIFTIPVGIILYMLIDPNA